MKQIEYNIDEIREEIEKHVHKFNWHEIANLCLAIENEEIVVTQ